MPFYRRYLPILIFLFILSDPTIIIRGVKNRITFVRNRNFEFVKVVVVFFPLIAIYVPINFRNYNMYEENHLIFPERFIYPYMDGLQKMGKCMNANIDQNKSVALGDVGAIGYYFKGTIIDMWGLNSLDIARRIEEYNDFKDEDFVNLKLGKEPDYIILKAFEKYQNSTDIYFKRYIRPLFLENEDFINNYTMIYYEVWKESDYYILYELN
ncbi:hypothetical protein LCGC14_0555440 [marine sediment metagenome]|uniref:Uncharacterized protein n=1 Tax=marine sediment metagenome TaxID=412755 RepID=A0A0F9U9Z1_9ZZZZ